MRNDTLRWLCAVSGKQKLHIAVLTLVHALHGASGVFYALLLRSVVDAAVGRDSTLFWRCAAFTALLVCVQLALRALIREGSWLLDEKGLVIFSDLYEIGSFADGVVRFAVSYEELDGLLREDWFPVAHDQQGNLNIEVLKAGENAKKQLLDKK